MKTNHSHFYTPTMAKIYEDQGEFSKAVEIYRYLINKNPDRQDFKDALDAIESRSGEKTIDETIDLLARWIQMMGRYNELIRLNRLKKNLS